MSLINVVSHESNFYRKILQFISSCDVIDNMALLVVFLVRLIFF